MSQYLTFTQIQPKGRKTPIVEVRSKSGDFLLGTIKWYSPWRQYCFQPEFDTIFNTGCMTDIQVKIAQLKAARDQS